MDLNGSPENDLHILDRRFFFVYVGLFQTTAPLQLDISNIFRSGQNQLLDILRMIVSLAVGNPSGNGEFHRSKVRERPVPQGVTHFVEELDSKLQ